MFKDLIPKDDTITTQITVTNGFFDGGVGTLAGSNYTTSSLSSTQKNYYYNIQYNSKDHFGVSYGHIGGSGSAEMGQYGGDTDKIYADDLHDIDYADFSMKLYLLSSLRR